MEEKNKNERLQSRREFFKKTAQNVLPFLGIVALSPLLTSCDPDDEDEPSGCAACTNQCTGCGHGCENDCSGSCEFDSH